ncbi:MAG: type I restriction endonuclease subunit R [Caldilineaceae bacterium SB0664_bin_22]|nr:type I restriction endonuclease subunit R [Caldilineaceae bacterium SB0664_bin_22]
MSTVGELEARPQERVVAFFQEIGYAYLGNWHERPDNRNIEAGYLTRFLANQGYSQALITKTLDRLDKAAALGGSRSLYDANRDVHGLLRYGVKVQDGFGQHVTVALIDWEDPTANDFAIAEEVTVEGNNTKRPDVVLYVNGIAICVLELKRSTVSVAQGIRQNLDNQKKDFIRQFFTTVQLVMAGNDTEGLRYGVIGTPEKYWLRWKEAGPPAANALGSPLIADLGYLCGPERLLELIHDFVVFDSGIKKICRHNQYFGVKEAQAYVQRREGGIIWHTQGSGKSLTMVWLAKWIRELKNVDSRVLIITDRTELDEQIEKVFKGVAEKIYRTKSGADLVTVLPDPTKSLICSLIHKFGNSEEGNVDRYVSDLRAHMSGDFQPSGELFVFVDECHRTQSGKLHRAMKAILPGATLIGFTGTPLLRSDKQRSIEIFGPYIHTYKYDEAVSDKVVLDLRYEARDIDQEITSEARIDQWFDSKTQGLSELARAQLRQRWGTMRNVTSSLDRIRKIVADILMDMEIRDRLKSGQGNAMLVSDSVYAACRFFDAFRETELKGKCAIVTSYSPVPGNIKGEETGEGSTENLLKYDVYRRMLAEYFDEPEDKAMYKVQQFEQEVKQRFVNEPGQMKLLIVVDKLLTGFDAPPATYLYIDKKMQDHGLFQAICRVNRLDGEDKEYGHVIDYKDLFSSLEGAIQDYTGEAFEGYDREDVEGLLKDRLERGRERLEETREAVKALCEPVAPPRDTEAYRIYFCHDEAGDGMDASWQLALNEQKRVSLYRMVAEFLRAYASLANEMIDAGYTEAERLTIRDEVSYFEKVRQEVKLASGDYVDLKVFEPAMRHLLDTYIRAEDSTVLAAFDDMTLIDWLVNEGEEAIDSLPEGIRDSSHAIAATIENNVRRLIVDEQTVNPRYYERMSKLLDDLIKQRREGVIEYKAYLEHVIALAKKVKSGQDSQSYPLTINTSALRSIYDNLPEEMPEHENWLGPKPSMGEALQVAGKQERPVQNFPDLRETVARAVDRAVRDSMQADWRNHPIKENQVQRAIHESLGPFEACTEEIFNIVKAQREY